MATCGSCRSPLPDGARFCPSCGQEVTVVAAEERRVVTVVFADLVGYTALSEHLDPERVKRLIDAAFERLIADINSFGGRVDKVLGDGILALFGAPVAHEDDADRAIRASIQMHTSLSEFVTGELDLDVSLQLRIGVNTGEVLVGSVSGTADYTAMGDVVNVASRLETMAAPGEIYVGDSTAALTSAEIMLELVDDIAVRGREQTERVWRVIGRRKRVPMLGARNDLPFVGRTMQRELLASIMSMVAGGRSAVVAVSGEAGIGKSRLVREALDAFPSRSVTIYSGICAPYGETNVWSPIATALLERIGLEPGTPGDRLREFAIGRGVELYGFRPDDPMLHRFVEGVLHLLDYPSELDVLTPAQSRETVFALIVEGLRRRSVGGPLVLWLDDLQWADSLIVDLLHRIARSLVDRPLLIITAQRDATELDWPPIADQPITVRMPLDPLDREEAASLVDAVLGTSVDGPFVDELFERSGGNPLFLTELAELAKRRPDSRELPGSLRALIAARLDQLPPPQRSIIDNAAVLGASGLIDSLQKFAVEMQQQFDLDDLESLADAGLIEVDDTSWRFRSDVVREVAYQTLTKLVRAQRHAGTATVMSNSLVGPLDMIAHHAATAAELVAEIGHVPGVSSTIGEEAVGLLHDAAQRSLDGGAFGQARRHATRALDLGVADADMRRELLLLRAEASTERRDTEWARSDALAVLDDAIVAGDRCDEAIARRLLGVLHQRDGDLPAARHELGESVEIFRALGDDKELASSLRERGFAELFGGSLQDAEWLLGEAEAFADRFGDRRGSAWVRQHQAWAAFLSGDTALAEDRLTTAAQDFELLGDRAGRGWALGLLAYVRFYEGDLAEAEKLAATVRAEAVELGDRWAPAMMDSLTASIRLWTMRFTEAEELSRRALVGFRELGDRFGVIQALGPRLRALIALGRSHEAERGLEEALAISESFGDLSFPAIAAAGAAVHLGVGAKALPIAELAVERGIRMGADGNESRVTLALAMCQVDRADEALIVLDEVVRESPYATAVSALTATITGDVAGGAALADSIREQPGATYLDTLIAAMAGAVAHTALGDDERAVEQLAIARHVGSTSGDHVASALAWSLEAGLAEAETAETAGASAGHFDLATRPDLRPHPLTPGWTVVLDGLMGIAREGAVRSSV